MRLLRAVSAATAIAAVSLAPIIAARNNPARRDDLSVATDICGEIDADFNVPNLLLPGKTINLGHIQECLCISGVSNFMSTHSFGAAALALVGEATTTQTLTNLIYNCPGQTCQYPPHSVPICQPGNPCGFTCNNGYTPYPAYMPTQCVCSPPYTECNGMCGMFQGCPSGYLAKRDTLRGKRCPTGYMACGIPSRGAGSWECLDTQTELESCGGCVLSLYDGDSPDGEDCTAIPGVADVSCVAGGCHVHRCMPGYEVASAGNSCVYREDRDPVLLAAQYGLDVVEYGLRM